MGKFCLLYISVLFRILKNNCVIRKYISKIHFGKENVEQKQVIFHAMCLHICRVKCTFPNS